jgi:hypothetical protein
MRVTAKKVPCGFDPQAIKRVFSAAWQAAARSIGWDHPVPKEITRIATRKRDHRAWCSAMTRTAFVSVGIWINPRRTMRQHAVDWYEALGGRGNLTFAGIADEVFPPAPPKQRTKRELALGERLREAQRRVEEWEGKRKAAQRELRLAKTKLRSYCASVRGLERQLRTVSTDQVVAYDDRAFTAHLGALRGPAIP